jgi:hypothetical protein
MHDWFGISDKIKRLTPPNGYGDVHIDGMSWAFAGHLYEDTTRIGADDWNRVIAQFRGLLTSPGIDLDDLATDQNLFLRAFIERRILADILAILSGTDIGSYGLLDKATYDPNSDGIIALAQGGSGVSATSAADFREKLGINQAVQNAIDALLGSAPEALDTLIELATALGNDPNFAATTATALGKRVRFDAGQTLSDSERGIARSNIGAGILSGFRNKIVNGDFTINQRAAATKAQAVGVYGYDRWKGHAQGIEQVVENLPAGDYTLSWTGGGNGSFAGTTGVSPVKATTAGGNISVVVPVAATRVSLLRGDATADPDPYPARHISQELALCQRYFNYLANVQPRYNAVVAGARAQFPIFFPQMRVNPSSSLQITLSQNANLSGTTDFSTTSNCHGALRIQSTSTGDTYFYVNISLDAEL